MNRKNPYIASNLDKPPLVLPTILKGIVVSTNDPQQEGRILVHFPILGGKPGNAITKTSVDHFKWIPYAPTIGGMGDEDLLRGPGQEGQDKDGMGVRTPGKAAYGWWSIPRKGAIVFCFVANDDPNDIHWFSCKYPTKASSTLFGGRFTNTGSSIDGPFTDNETPLEPVYSNQTQAFGGRDGNYEWISRVADYNPGMVSESDLRAQLHPNNKKISSGNADKIEAEITLGDGTVVGRTMKYTQGYARSRSEPGKETNTQHDIDRLRNTEQNSESTMHGFSTPSGHYISFDDRPEQCRLKIRTSTGHTLLLDDTNDRIYIATNKGGNWFEMDSNGHIYFFSDESISMHAMKHINFTASDSIRLYGKKGVHVVSEDGEFRLNVRDAHISSANWNQQTNNYDFTADVGKLDIKDYNASSSTMKIESTSFNLKGQTGDIKFSGKLSVFSTGKMSLRSSAVLAVDGSSFAMQAGASDTASPDAPQTAIEPKPAFWTNITPMHEPWARTFNGDKNVDELFTHTPQYTYDSAEVNRDMKQQESDYQRGPLWQR